jgi:predicted enzyme related to lactoylglutathione lyase
MPDPFEALWSPPATAAPDPDFAARLRARVERALALPRGVVVSETGLASASDPYGPRASGVTPYLIVTNARRAVEWYVEVFGASRRAEPIVMGDGRVGHAEIAFGAGLLYLADESPESDVAAPRPDAGATVSLVVEVPDVDTTVERATGAGAAVERPAADNPYGRNAVVRDPFGHRWIVSAASDRRDAAAPAFDAGAPDGGRVRQGDIGYVSLWVPDVVRAERFFGRVLGWSFAPGSIEAGRQVVGTSPHHGLWGNQERSTLFLCYVVDDVDDAVDRVRGAGGRAEEPADEPYGRVASCVDDQGTAFAVFRPPPGVPAPRLAPHGSREGDLAYVTMEVEDSSRALAFYGAVLGWRATPGHVDDGWQLDDVRPGTGMHGGNDRATTVPMYLVDDIGAAVERVRAAGGTASGVERKPYGLQATCVDDQGTRFYLGQL